MRKMKKFLAGALTLTMGIGLMTACSAGGTNTPTKDSDSTQTTAAVEETSGADQGGSTVDWPQISAIDFANLMGNGINLGNTMEATSKSLGHDSAVSNYETAWGQPVTTAEMIQGMKDCGFDTIRIPVAWTNSMHIVDGDYTISDEYLARVKEIVDYAYAADMYVIVNDHWDGGWWGMFGSATESTVDAAWKVYESIWTQVGTYFADYDYHLIFESGNEEIGPRLNDVDTNYTELTSDSGTLSDDEFYACANAINQKFVDIIRGQGGNNAMRYLLIAGSGTEITRTLDSRFEMPKDTAEDKLLLSVHCYDPSNYTGAAGDSSVSEWGKKTEVEQINETLAKLKTFTDQGIPIVIGEYGVLYHNQPQTAEDLREGHITYLKNFLSNCDLYGFVPVLWDCNGIYNKSTCTIDVTALKNVYDSYSNASRADMTQDEIKEAAQKQMDKILADAPEYIVEDGTAWIMYSASDWAVSSSVGDAHPVGASDGLVSVEPIVKEPGSYVASLDFTGTNSKYASSFAFCALGILGGETNMPGCKIQIDAIIVNGEPVDFLQNYYTTADDKLCTRVNIYNAWVVGLGETLGGIAPEEARCIDGDIANAASCILDASDATFSKVETFEVQFTVLAGE